MSLIPPDTLIDTLELIKKHDKTIVGYPDVSHYTDNDAVLAPTVERLVLDNIRRMHGAIFNSPFIFAVMPSKKKEEYLKIKTFLIDNGFYLHSTSDEGYADMDEYWVSNKHESMISLSNTEGFIKRTPNAESHASIDLSICLSNRRNMSCLLRD